MKIGKQFVFFLLMVVACGSSAHANLLYDWTFDGTNGQTATLPEAVGNNTGTVIGGGSITTVTGSAAIGTGAFYRGTPNGNNDRISVATNFDAPSQYTIAAWVKTSQANYPNMFAWSSPGALGREFRLNGGALDTNEFMYGSHASLGGGTSVNDNQWHFVAVTRELGGSTSLFVDTIFDLEDESGLEGYSGFSGAPVYLAGHDFHPDYNYSLDGSLDDVSFWNERLDRTKLTSIRNLGTSTLNYNATDAASLFNVFSSGEAATVEGRVWYHVPASSLSGGPGDVVALPDGNYGLVLDIAGGGVSTLPEPGAGILLAVGVLCVVLGKRRLRRR
jgi:hypothetical protein